MIRYFHKLWAKFNGYFWMPCPVCGRNFGGHESSEYAVNYRWHQGYVKADLVCRSPACRTKAEKQHTEFYRESIK